MYLLLSDVTKATALISVVLVNVCIALMLVSKARENRALWELSREAMLVGIGTLLLSVVLYTAWFNA